MLLNLFAILFICVTVTDRFNFFENFSGEIHRLLTGNTTPAQLPYVLRCSLCQTFWLGLLYILFTHHFTILGIAAVVLVAGCNSIALQFLNVIEMLIITIFSKITPEK